MSAQSASLQFPVPLVRGTKGPHESAVSRCEKSPSQLTQPLPSVAIGLSQVPTATPLDPPAPSGWFSSTEEPPQPVAAGERMATETRTARSG